MGQDKSSFFEKNISSDFALVLRNFALWVNENDEICSVAALHEKFFRVPKLRFLVLLTCPLGEKELHARCSHERPKMTLKHFPLV